MKKSRSQLAALAVMTAGALSLSACGGGGEPSAAQSPSVSTETPAAGGDLSILVASSMASWDPGSSTGSFPGVQWDRLYAVYGALFTVKSDGSIEYGFADDMSTDDGGATWTMTLKPGLTFTDGQPLDAEAVKANFDRFADPENNLGAVAVASLFTSEVVDETTLKLTAEEPNPVLDVLIGNNMPFVASPEAFPEAGATMTEPVGAGPFILESWDGSVGETLTKNEDYYQEGLPYLDTLSFQIVSDPAQRVSTVVSGGAQMMNGYPFQWISDTDNPAVGAYPVASGGIRHFVFNTQGELFDDVRARQAVQRAIDPTEMVQTLTQDPAASGSTAMFPEDSPYYDPALALPESNTGEAQALVDEVVAEQGDFEVDLLVAAVPELVRAGELLQLSLEELEGVEVNLTQIEIADWRTAAFDQDDFDITFYPGVFDLNSPEVGMSSLLGEGGLDNFANFSNSDLEAAVQAAESAATDEERVKAVKDIQQVYVDQVPLVVFGIDYRSFLHGADVVGFDSMGRGALYTDRIGYPED